MTLAFDWNQVSSAITAVATVGLAYYAYRSFKGVKDQMNLINKQSADMKRQADAIESQSNFVHDQSIAMQDQAATMKSQSDSMEKQSNLMLENMEYDRLVKKYERVSGEMVKLVGPLYARRKDANIFSLNKRSGRIFVSPTARVPDPNPNALIYDFVSFWDSIDQNMYLNRSRLFLDSFNNYNANINAYFESHENEKENLRNMFNERKETFSRDIERRYAELGKELNEIEEELKIRNEKRKNK